MNIAVLNSHRYRNLPTPSHFERWTQAVFQLIPTNYQALCIALINEKESAALNQIYRHKSGPTNILSFSYNDTTGDLAMCVPLIQQEAKQQKKTLRAHFAHLTVHGTLHLLGHDHIHAKDALKMEALERKILRLLRFKDPYR